MNFIPQDILDYLEKHTSALPEVLHELYRETWQKSVNPRMLSGPVQGQLLSMISHMLQPRYVVEIGTFTGFSAICLAQGMDKGKLVTIDTNDEIAYIAKKYFEKAGVDGLIDQRIGDAKDILPRLAEGIDLVFIDADKKDYAKYYDLVFPLVKVGGHILADNTLWSGKVVQEIAEDDVDTKALIRFNKKIQEDPKVENVLIPMRDGLTLIRKICD